MAKRSIDEILDGSLPENVKNENKWCINRGKNAFISLDELSNYYFSRFFVTRKIEYLEFITGNSGTFSRLINSFYKNIFFTGGERGE